MDSLGHTLRGCVDWNNDGGYVLTGEVKSHPAWVCGLKQSVLMRFPVGLVTPCVGVWIETLYDAFIAGEAVSHPAWVCGLKP